MKNLISYAGVIQNLPCGVNTPNVNPDVVEMIRVVREEILKTEPVSEMKVYYLINDLAKYQTLLKGTTDRAIAESFGGPLRYLVLLPGAHFLDLKKAMDTKDQVQAEFVFVADEERSGLIRIVSEDDICI